MTHLKDNLKIIFALIVSLTLVFVLSQTVFLPGTPRLNTDYLAGIFDRITARILTIGMTPVKQGVYAKEDKNKKTVYLRYTKEVKWQQTSIEYNGKKYIISSPL